MCWLVLVTLLYKTGCASAAPSVFWLEDKPKKGALLLPSPNVACLGLEAAVARQGDPEPPAG